MAAKQGFTAQISQLNEDAKRAMIARAPTSIKAHSWLSNLNTTCTIKSAPPRSPEVMSMLAAKSGWLVKRNEQQVWQRRWCCVVPHTFLYYFEAAPNLEAAGGKGGGAAGDGAYQPPGAAVAVVENQEMLNAAVDGLEGWRDRTGPSGSAASSYYPSPFGDFGGGAGGGDGNLNESLDSANPDHLPDPRGPTAASGSNLQPVGIIDLECYSNVNRTNRSEGVMELTGDPITNPDLRSFYFQAASADDAEEWTAAFLTDRHSALRDEREALREVCTTFPLQIKEFSDMIDRAEEKADEAEKELYRVRSMAEEGRRRSLELVREILDRRCWEEAMKEGQGGGGGEDGDRTSSMKTASSAVQRRLIDGLEDDRTAYLEQLEESLRSPEAVGTMNGGVLPAMQLLTDYVGSVVASYIDLGKELDKAEQRVTSSAGVDKASLQELRAKYEDLEHERLSEKHREEERIAELEAELEAVKETLAETEQHLKTQRMEFAMYQSQSKSKLSTINNHKKILKKEVIDLRKVMEAIKSERDAAKHEAGVAAVDLETDRERNKTLERYIERIEKQVTAQQHMMEMMSHSGSVRDGSLLGRVIGPSEQEEEDGVNTPLGTPTATPPPPSVERSGRKNLLPRSYKKSSLSKSRRDENRDYNHAGVPPKINLDMDVIVVPTSSPEKSPAFQRSPMSTDTTSRNPVLSLETLEPLNDRKNFNLREDNGEDGGNMARLDENEVKANSRRTKREKRDKRRKASKYRESSTSHSEANNQAGAPYQGNGPLSDQDLDRTIQDYERNHASRDEETDDVKSHISELTEDRTYKLPAYEQSVPTSAAGTAAPRPAPWTTRRSTAPDDARESKPRNQRQGQHPSRYIDSEGERLEEKSFISARSRPLDGRPPAPYASSSPQPIRDDPRYDEVSERARGSRSRSRRVARSPSRDQHEEDSPAPSRPFRPRSISPTHSDGGNSRRSFLRNVGQRITRAIDNSVIGLQTDDDYDSEDESSSYESSSLDEQTKTEVETPLHVRQQMQREKQLAFLKEQGILNDERKLRGGAGATPVKDDRGRYERSSSNASLSSRRSSAASRYS